MRPTEPRWFIGLLLVWALPSAFAEMSEISARTGSRDVKIPKAVVERLEEEHKAFLLRENRVYRKEAFKRKLINITAEFTPKSGGALRDAVRVLTPIGGGVIDLEEIVTPLMGAFRLNLKPAREDGEPFLASRVYYISRAKARKIAGESFGAGCGKFIEMTSFFNKHWSAEGFDLYSADQRYLSVLGGTFLFVQFAKEALFVGAVTFTDSRYPDLLCE